MKSIVIIPTYNEMENIAAIISAVFDIDSHVSILVVDDSSPDGTGDIVQNLKNVYPRLNLLTRPKKEGLGRAYIAGFEWALERDFEFIVEMDADFSHRPQDLSKILAAASTSDVVVGSRYIENGGTVNWSLFRKAISRGGSLYSRMILGFPICDWTGGFNGWNANVLRKIEVSKIQSNGYSFQIELKYKAKKHGFKVLEIPIVFEDRQAGKSKMSGRIVLEAFYRVWQIRYSVILEGNHSKDDSKAIASKPVSSNNISLK